MHQGSDSSAARRAGNLSAAGPETALVPAWRLTEGTELADRSIVLEVQREPVGRVVEVVTDDPRAGRARYGAEELVDVVRLAR